MTTELPVISGLTEEQALTLVYCRYYGQYVSMLEGYLAGQCPFCDPMNDSLNRIVRVSRGWRMWKNPFAIQHSALHLVLAPRNHIISVDQITASDFTDIGRLFIWARKKYKLTGGGFAMRFGSPRMSTGTVLHLHANIIIPDLTGEVEVVFAKTPEKVAEQVSRMHVFEKLRLGAELTSLDPSELKLVEGRVKR